MATTGHPNPSFTPCWILFDSQAYIGDKSNYNNTSVIVWRDGLPILVTLCPAHPPIPSRLIVHYPYMCLDEVILQKPSIVCTVEDILLLRVPTACKPTVSTIWSRTRGATQKMCNYLIYRSTGPGGPSLQVLPSPHPGHFRDDEVGLLSHGDHQFTVAALSATTTGNQFVLHLFKSEKGSWSSKKVLLKSPQERFLVPIPDNAYRLFQHITSTVIMLGGAHGTIGWVDLWRGVLLCDVLCDDPDLRGVPMPPPMPERLSDPEDGLECCPKLYRSIAVIKNYLKVVELQVSGIRLPNNDPETNGPNFKIDNWTLTMYTNTKIATTNDWVMECTVKASDIEIDEAMRGGLLLKPGINQDAGRNLQNLHTCQPVLGLDDEDIITKSKFLHHEAWVLAVNMRKRKLEAMARIEAQRSLDSSLAYCPTRISSYIHPDVPVVSTDLLCSGNQLQQAVQQESTAVAQD